MGDEFRPGRDCVRDARGKVIRRQMETVAEQAAHIGVALKDILGSTKDHVASDQRRWHEPATVMAVKAQQVRSTIKSRRMRNEVFGDNLFGEPAWDMLLDLYASHLEQKRVSVSSLQIASAVPGTTALRVDAAAGGLGGATVLFWNTYNSRPLPARGESVPAELEPNVL